MYRHDFLRNRTLGTAAGVVKFDKDGIAVEFPKNEEEAKKILDASPNVKEYDDATGKPVVSVKAKPKEKAVKKVPSAKDSKEETKKAAPKKKETKSTTTKTKTTKKATKAKAK